VRRRRVRRQAATSERRASPGQLSGPHTSTAW
jgi:hypothetical protein